MSAQEWLDRTQTITDAATEGPWEAGRGWVYTDPVYADDRRLSNVLGMSFADHERQEEELARGERNAEFIAHARTALPEAVAALQAVMKLHQPDDSERCTECIIGHDGDSFIAGAPVHDAWPCPTITAIQDAIGGQA